MKFADLELVAILLSQPSRCLLSIFPAKSVGAAGALGVVAATSTLVFSSSSPPFFLLPSPSSSIFFFDKVPLYSLGWLETCNVDWVA